MISMPVLNVVDPQIHSAKTMKLAFAAFPLSTQHQGGTTKNRDNVSQWNKCLPHRLFFSAS